MIFDSPHRRFSPWCAALLGAAVLILMPTFLPDAHAQDRLDPQTVEHALACSDNDTFMGTMERLSTDLKAAAKTGVVRREQITQLANATDDVQWEYRFLQPFPLFGMQAVGIGNSLGMLPALVVVFDEPLRSFKKRYERTGFKFVCGSPSELQGEACEGSLDIAEAPPGQPPLRFLVTIMESPVFLKAGRTLVACTIVPREGNVFR